MMFKVDPFLEDTLTLLIEAESEAEAQDKAMNLGDQLSQAIRDVGLSNCLDNSHSSVNLDPSIHTGRKGLELETSISYPAEVDISNRTIGYALVYVDYPQLELESPLKSKVDPAYPVSTNLESAQQALKEAKLKSPDRIYWIDKVTFQMV